MVMDVLQSILFYQVTHVVRGQTQHGQRMILLKKQKRVKSVWVAMLVAAAVVKTNNMKKIIVTGEDLKDAIVTNTEGKIVRMEFENATEGSDGYHTFDELYEHRIRLFVTLCNALNSMNRISRSMNMNINFPVWRSKLHQDGTMFDNWFIMGIFKNKGEQITYHLPIAMWEATNFAETLEKAPEWDGHTPADVVERLKRF